MPVTKIINQSFVSGAIPTEWKEAKITPIFKAAKEKSYEKLTPNISITTCFEDYGKGRSNSTCELD